MSENTTIAEDTQAFMVESLPDHPRFQGLSGRHRKLLANCSERTTFSPGDTVVETGDPTDRFFLVTSGSIGLESPGAHPWEKAQTLGPGDILGWSWLFPSYFWPFDAVAKEHTEALRFSISLLCQECDRDHQFGLELFKRMSPAKQLPSAPAEAVSLV